MYPFGILTSSITTITIALCQLRNVCYFHAIYIELPDVQFDSQTIVNGIMYQFLDHGLPQRSSGVPWTDNLIHQGFARVNHDEARLPTLKSLPEQIMSTKSFDMTDSSHSIAR